MGITAHAATSLLHLTLISTIGRVEGRVQGVRKEMMACQRYGPPTDVWSLSQVADRAWQRAT